MCRRAGLEEGDGDRLATYAEQSGTSTAAPHVSGVVAAFLSARPEFVGRERYAQGAGLVDPMRMRAGV